MMVNTMMREMMLPQQEQVGMTAKRMLDHDAAFGENGSALGMKRRRRTNSMDHCGEGSNDANNIVMVNNSLAFLSSVVSMMQSREEEGQQQESSSSNANTTATEQAAQKLIMASSSLPIQLHHQPPLTLLSPPATAATTLLLAPLKPAPTLPTTVSPSLSPLPFPPSSTLNFEGTSSSSLPLFPCTLSEAPARQTSYRSYGIDLCNSNHNNNSYRTFQIETTTAATPKYSSSSSSSSYSSPCPLIKPRFPTFEESDRLLMGKDNGIIIISS